MTRCHNQFTGGRTGAEAIALGGRSLRRILRARSNSVNARNDAAISQRVIGASDGPYKKYELDSLDQYLYRLRIRERTVD